MGNLSKCLVYYITKLKDCKRNQEPLEKILCKPIDIECHVSVGYSYDTDILYKCPCLSIRDLNRCLPII